MTQTKKSTSKKSASKESPIDTENIQIIIDIINDRYESNKDEKI